MQAGEIWWVAAGERGQGVPPGTAPRTVFATRDHGWLMLRRAIGFGCLFAGLCGVAYAGLSAIVDDRVHAMFSHQPVDVTRWFTLLAGAMALLCGGLLIGRREEHRR